LKDYYTIGISRDRLYSTRAKSAVRFLHKKLRKKQFYLTPVKEREGASTTQNSLKAVEDMTADIAVVELAELFALQAQEVQNEYKYSAQVEIALVFRQGDSRYVLVTSKKTKKTFDYAVVECDSPYGKKFLTQHFDDVSVREGAYNLKLQFQRIALKKCDAAFLPADYVRILRLHRERGFRYQYFACNDALRAIWVAVVRKDNKELREKLIRYSDEKTVKSCIHVLNQLRG